MVNQHKSYPICPPWLKPLISAKFFDPCNNHNNSTSSPESTSTRIECNLFCLDCMSEPLCFGCTFTHKNHHIVQIRRSSYHDVIRVSEIQKVLDLSGVQSYIINSARVVFLNGRPQTKLAKGVTKTCEVCARSLNENFRYCSLGCKLQGIDKHNELTFILQPKTQLQVSTAHHRVYPEDGSPKRSRSSKRASAAKLVSQADSEDDHHELKIEAVQDNAEKVQHGLTTNTVPPAVADAAQSTKPEPGTADGIPEPGSVDGETSCNRNAGCLTGKVDDAQCEAGIAVENLVEISPSTPPQVMSTVCHQRAAKRRKGTPHRSHLGGLTMVN